MRVKLLTKRGETFNDTKIVLQNVGAVVEMMFSSYCCCCFVSHLLKMPKLYAMHVNPSMYHIQKKRRKPNKFAQIYLTIFWFISFIAFDDKHFSIQGKYYSKWFDD